MREPPSNRTVTAFEARTHLGELLDYVRFEKEPCFIERHGHKVAALLDIASYQKAVLPQHYWSWVRESVEEIKKRYHPIKIILFGSLVRGHVQEGSDIDLLIIKKTSKRQVDRIQDVLKCLSPENPVEPHVYTPQEFQKRLRQRDPFFLQATNQGIVLYDETQE